MGIPTSELSKPAAHPFYRRLNQLLCDHGFDDFVESQCAGFYAETMGRPGLSPGIFRLLLIGFLGIGPDQAPPDHSTISRTRRLIALETHRAVFT